MGKKNSSSSPAPRATAVIIGRAGSKGLPGKNERFLAGRPMVAHSIEHARAARLVGRIIVSSDSPRILQTARDLNVDAIDRPAELAADDTTVDAAVRHAVEDDDAEVIVILYANVPIRPEGLIDRAVSTLIETGADSVQSYAPVGKHHPFWESRIDNDGRVSAYVVNSVYRRQDLPPLYVPDGGVIVVRRAALFTVIPGQPHAFLGTDRRGIVNPEGAVVDIDSAIDLAFAEFLLTRGVVTGVVNGGAVDEWAAIAAPARTSRVG